MPDTGFEPVTYSLLGNRSTAELIRHATSPEGLALRNLMKNKVASGLLQPLWQELTCQTTLLESNQNCFTETALPLS